MGAILIMAIAYFALNEICYRLDTLFYKTKHFDRLDFASHLIEVLIVVSAVFAAAVFAMLFVANHSF